MAAGDTLVVLTMHSADIPPVVFGPVAVMDVRANVLVADFDADATNTSLEFGFVLPRHYAGGGTNVTLIWAASSATSGNVVWDAAWKSISDDVDDLDSKAFASVQTVTAAAPSVSGEVSYDTITFTDGAQMDSAAVGEYTRLRIRRQGDNVSDTMTGDAELVAVEIRETP